MPVLFILEFAWELMSCGHTHYDCQVGLWNQGGSVPALLMAVASQDVG